MKTAIDFENKLVEYGTILREYDEVEALCQAAGWKSNRLYARLEEIGQRRDRVAVPLLTLMRQFAKEIS